MNDDAMIILVVSWNSYSKQKYVIYVIYGHAAQIISCNLCKLDQTHLDHATFWT